MDNYLYLAINLSAISIPFACSFEHRVKYFNKFLSFAPSFLLTVAFFIIWDIFFTECRSYTSTSPLFLQSAVSSSFEIVAINTHPTMLTIANRDNLSECWADEVRWWLLKGSIERSQKSSLNWESRLLKRPQLGRNSQRHLTGGSGNDSKKRIWHISTFVRARFSHVYSDISCW